MKSPVLVCLFVTCMFVAACGSQPAAPATEAIVATAVLAVTSAPAAALPTVTTIPLPRPLNTAAAAVSTGPYAIPNSGALNCRTGPDTAWQVATVLYPDQSAEIVGKNAESTWWYVRNPYLPGSFCWISAGFATVTGDVSAVQVVSAPPPPVVYPKATASITKIYMGVEPSTISVPGCIGPVQTVQVWAKITTNGPIVLDVYFEDEELGELLPRQQFYTRADTQDVWRKFTPLLIPGKHTVRLVIEGMDLTGLGPVTTYEIDC